METESAFQLLADANPVPSARLGELGAELISDKKAAAARMGIPLRADRFQVPSRRRLSARELAFIGAVLALSGVLLAAAPAFGLKLTFLPFSSAAQAPPPVVEKFSDLAIGAPPRMDPGVITGQARRAEAVTLSDGPHVLWVAPTKKGQFCLLWTDLFGGCREAGSTNSIDVTFMTPRLSGVATEPQVVLLLGGYVDATAVRTVEVRYEDGTVKRPDVLWVSAPISAGFFLYEVPADHRVAGHLVSSVVALDKDGKLVSSESLPGSR